jgi:hypothetical protein
MFASSLPLPWTVLLSLRADFMRVVRRRRIREEW